MKTIMPLIALLALSGCATSFGKVRNTMTTTPDWYDNAREEIRGEGFPTLSDAPELASEDVKATENALSLSRQEIADARQMFAEHPRAAQDQAGAQRIAATQAELKVSLRQSGPTPTLADADNILTQPEIDRIKARLNSGRARTR